MKVRIHSGKTRTPKAQPGKRRGKAFRRKKKPAAAGKANRLRKRRRTVSKKTKRKLRNGGMHGAAVSLDHPAPLPVSETAILRTYLPGVNLIGTSRAESGIGESCRLAAKSLQTTNIPYGIKNIAFSPSRTSDDSWAHKEIPEAIYKVNIIHMNADSLQAIDRSLLEGRYNIGVWHWELPDFPNEWLGAFDLVREVWAPSRFILESVSRKSTVPVLRIPHGIEVYVPEGIGRDFFGLPGGRFLFLSMYDTFSYAQRKNPHGAIEAFQSAFAPDDPGVGLVIKVNNPQSEIVETAAAELHKLRERVAGWSNIFLIEGTLSRAEVNALMNAADCFVSLHRSEGFGLGLAESMYLGKPVIGTNWSGNTDFMNSMNSCTVDYRLVPVGVDYGPYKAYQYWADPDIEHASHYMRRLVQDAAWRELIAGRGQATVRSEFSPQAAGALMAQRLRRMKLLG
ncbi:glycosyltransferase [Paenibacillus hamazuiensis]|uniref:glycosyltransferase n=1 Tax=Paenibacillus hamazuiensis TaxID=2936508 RepID=UPI00200FA979|nr:glycosyltransferase [Paenibacillus hamazuiensis]